MGYFEDHYSDVHYAVGTDSRPGLRNAQLGAIHAVAAQLTQEKGPGIVVLPTGSGKTAVLMMAAYVARASRALVVTPSRLVRSQIAEDFGSLRTLKKAGVLDVSVPAPKVHEVGERISSQRDWRDLRAFDVVVGTPNSLSAEYEEIPAAPAELFDLILVDEAHHAPARTWHGVLTAFAAAKQMLFTATPFRRDEKEIRGKLIYMYSVREAYRDGIFSDINFEAVYPADGQSSDAAIALAAELALVRDRESGLDHRLMVRTDRKARASELEQIYGEQTRLKLRAINSNHSLGHVRRVIRQLRDGDLDGVICVDMLGEGFDLPSLKLAAVHSPHRSLEVTLQFIGRFARAGAERLGQARFFAVPSEIEAETGRLYKEGAVWGEMVQNLSQGRIDREQRIRDSFERFHPPDVVSDETFDMSLAALRPYFHVKIYRLSTAIDISTALEFPAERDVVFHTFSEEDGTAVFITREIEQARWTSLDEFARIQYDLFVVVYDAEARLLFINSSIRSTGLCETVAESYTAGAHQILSLARVNRVLAGISDTEFFNVGMKNTMPNSPTESYRIIAGPRADEAIHKTDGRMFHRGHVFGKGTAEGEPVTIGYSSASKVWSNRNAQIPDLVAWCRILARKISSEEQLQVTRSGLDNLSVGEEINGVPSSNVIAADWNESAYKTNLSARYRHADGGYREGLLVDLKLEVDHNSVTQSTIPFAIVGDEFAAKGIFRLEDGQFRFELDEEAQRVSLTKRDEGVGLAEWLRNYPIDFYLADFSRLRGAELFRARFDQQAFARERVTAVDWSAQGINIEREFGAGDGRPIHDFVRNELVAKGEGVVVYDHRPGEVADFVLLRSDNGRGEVVLFHVKASSSNVPGDRVSDVYEVCGQVVRSPRWFYDLGRLRERLIRRVATGSQFVLGDRAGLDAAFDEMASLPVTYKVVLVQPGISRSAISERTEHVLAAADDYLVRANAERLEVWGSP